MQPPKPRTLQVQTPQGQSGLLTRESPSVFNHATRDRGAGMAPGMPLRAQSYAQNTLHPIFATTLPKGALHAAIRQRFAKQFARLDEMALLLAVGHEQIDRLRPKAPKPAQIGLRKLLASGASYELFTFPLDEHLAAGISGGRTC